jgi:hypothetical protein
VKVEIDGLGILKKTHIFIFGCWNYLLVRFVTNSTFFSCKNDECENVHLSYYFKHCSYVF